MKRLSEAKNSNSFEMVSIDDHATSPTTPQALLSPHRQQAEQSRFSLSPRGRLVALAGYLMVCRQKLPLLATVPHDSHITTQLSFFFCGNLTHRQKISGLSSLYFCLVQAGLDKIEVCESIAGCLFYSTQGWPALGEQSVDLLVMSYISGTISVIGGLLGTFGIYAAYKVNQKIAITSHLGYPFFLSIAIILLVDGHTYLSMCTNL